MFFLSCPLYLKALFCVGDFFGEKTDEIEAFLENPASSMFYQYLTVLVPLPTYALCPTTSTALRFITDMNGCELCPNLKFLGFF